MPDDDIKEKRQKDKELVERCIRGDNSAWKEIDLMVSELASKIFGENASEREDIKQNFLVHLREYDYKALKSWRGAAGLKTWLSRCVYNSGSREYKKIKKTQSLDKPIISKNGDDNLTLTDTLSTGENVLKNAISNEIMKKIEEALNKIGKNYRIVYESREFKGMKFCQISKKLKKPLNTVLQEYKRAKEQLAELLKDYEEGGE